jgi:hypothetical protein
MVLRLNCWSGPRNVSTALMYSFRQRADTTVVDEPLYGHYLRVTGRGHPGADDIMAAVETSGDRVVAETILGAYDTPVVFFKQMAHHLVNLDLAFLGQCRNMLLVRDPREMLPSLAVQLPDANLNDTGLAWQVELAESIVDAGDTPIVLDSRVLLTDPEAALTELCSRLGLAFDPAVLSWPAGPIREDGVWARYWYENVHKSTGFAPYEPQRRDLPSELQPVLDAAIPLYDTLMTWAIPPGAVS